MPSWLIIAIGLAVVVFLAWPLIVGAVVALFAVLCFLIAGVLHVVERLLIWSGFYRRRSDRRVARARARRQK